MSELRETHEIEAKRIFVGPEGRDAFERAARAHDLALEAAEPSSSSIRRLELQDRYLDLEGDPLRARDSGLRLRQEGERTLLTFKGPADVREVGLVDRLELEGEWSRATLTRLLDHLATVGLPLPPPGACDVPLETLERLGFRIVQARRTVRRAAPLRECVPELRALLAGDGTRATPNVEVALDEVHYETGTRRVVHREVEYEAGDAEAAAALSSLSKSLAPPESREVQAGAGRPDSPDPEGRPCPGPLRAWTWSKTALGAELERLEQEGRLAALVDGDALTAEGYAEIDARLGG